MALVAAVLLGAGCDTVGPGAPPPIAGGAEPPDIFSDELRVGDTVLVVFADIMSPPSIGEQRIRDDGKITLPYDQEVIASGKRMGDLEREIRDLYVPKYYVRLTVSVKRGEAFVFVGGYVRQPGRFLYSPEMTVLQAVKVAGDFSEYGDKARVDVTRGKTRQTFRVNCKKAIKDPQKYDVRIYPGDSIYVHQRYY